MQAHNQGPTPKVQMSAADRASEKSQMQLDFHLQEAALYANRDSSSSDGEDAVELQGADAFRKKFEMKFS